METEKSAVFTEALHKAHSNRHRLLVVLSGSHAWCKNLATAWYANASQRVWIDDATKARETLGSEYTLAILDAHTGLSPDCVAAVSGTLVAGGVLVLLTPAWEHWGTVPDPDYTRLASYPHDWRNLSSRFLLYFRKALTAFSENSDMFFHWHEAETEERESPFTRFVQPVREKNIEPGIEQQSCLHRLFSHHGISVLLADRGCGKSATLGFAARHWREEGKSVLLIAPSRAAARRVFDRAGNDLPFCAPDHLLADTSIAADILLVDEAAALPVPMLLAMLARFPHAVLATTTDGYEGTGQGFVLRFLRELERCFPTWQRLQLDTPIRWAADDPLSGWLYQTLLLDAVEPQLPGNGPDLSAVILDEVSQWQLAQNEKLLTDIYGLLRSAHYRTTPDDLRFLLDAPAVSVYRLAQGSCTLAVALLVEEGGMDVGMAGEIAAGRRRPRGHLLVQSLAVHLQQPQFLQERVSRIVRIAVHTQCQSKGLGSRLLQQVLQEQKERGIRAVGSSFSAAPDVVQFWLKNGFELLRVGYRRQAASAEPSALVLRVFDT